MIKRWNEGIDGGGISNGENDIEDCERVCALYEKEVSKRLPDADVDVCLSDNPRLELYGEGEERISDSGKDYDDAMEISEQAWEAALDDYAGGIKAQGDKIMKKVISVKGQSVEFTNCAFEFEGNRVDGVYIHQISDVNRDGDCVVGNGCEVPETEDEAEAILENESPISDAEILRTVKF